MQSYERQGEVKTEAESTNTYNTDNHRSYIQAKIQPYLRV